MHRFESDSQKAAVNAAEQILHDANAFNEESVVSAAEAIIKSPSAESRMVNVGLTPEMVEFLSSIFSEQSQAELESPQIPQEADRDIPPSIQEGVISTLSVKFATLNQLAERFPGQVQLSVREISLIRSQLTELIARLKQQGYLSQLKLFKGMCVSINKTLDQAEINIHKPELEGEIEFINTDH